MKLVNTREAIGHVLCHDMTQIVMSADGEPISKGARFKKGHVVRPEDIDVLLSMGKEHLYVWELPEGFLHENDAAERLAALVEGTGTKRVPGISEGKISIAAATDGVLMVDSSRLYAINAQEEVMVATRHGNTRVAAGDVVAATRVIPLVIDQKRIQQAEEAAEGVPCVRVLPWAVKTAAIMATGSEVAEGLIEDRFTPVIKKKLASFGVDVVATEYPGDDPAALRETLERFKASQADLIVCTGGMSVDPDDNTPGAIKQSGARIVTYGAPVLPGAMMLMGYYPGLWGVSGELQTPGKPVVGLPGCVMYNAATIFDLVLPRIVAGVELKRADFVALGEGGLCLNCEVCHYPICPFGR